jgi:4-diphosphocytidyl-2-C-methyl-D-erythritol kinase
MNKITLNSFAKINFGLNIVSKRPDGYHNIETIFHPLQLHDEIIIKKSNSFNFKSNNEAITSDNIIIKAKKLLEKYVSQIFLVDIILQKNIPLGAGLGGGSSNAAAALLALNKLFNLNLPEKELSHLAVQLGSDVPFFLDPKPKYAQGKGEILEQINFKINNPVLIVNPGIHISTPWAYSKIFPQKPVNNLKTIIENRFNEFSTLKGKVTNDFEEIVFKRYPEIESIKDKLLKLGAEFSLMTGSGSTLFGIFPDLYKAKEAEKFFSEKYFTFIHFEGQVPVT